MAIHLIAIAGGSGSGKSWLARHLLAGLGETAGGLALDDFYRDLSPLPKAERDVVNFDHPDAIDWPLFHQVLDRIRANEPTEVPAYDFTTHCRRAVPKHWEPRPIVVLDGLWLLHRPELRPLYSLSVYLDCPAEMRLARRVARDETERNRTAASVESQFAQVVDPMHRRFVAPQAAHADWVVESPLPAARLAGLEARCRQFTLSPTRI